MVDANVSGDTGRPDPAEATTPAEFVGAMRALKRWTGLGFRELEKRATAGGHVLPRSTVTVALNRDTLPREELVAAFAHACGCGEEETARWVTARRRVAAAGAPALTAPPPESEPVSAPESEPASAPESASSSPAKTTPESATASPAEAVPVSPPRRARRLVPALAALAAVATIVTFLLGSAGPDDARRGGNHAAPTSPPTTSGHGSPGQDPAQAPDPGPTPASEAVPTTAAEPGQVVPAAAESPDPHEPPGTQDPTHEPPKEPANPDHVIVPIEGQPPIYCPLPYLNTPYGAVAQCTQMSGGQARIGFYSFVTGEFGPQTDWVDVVEDRWFDGPIAATDGVEAVARGFGVLNTPYGGGVFATQYRDGEARWGTISVVTGEFHPSSDRWTPL